MIQDYDGGNIKMIVDNYSARKYTDAFIRFLEINYDRELSDLELNLLNWLSDYEVKDIAEQNYDIEFLDD